MGRKLDPAGPGDNEDHSVSPPRVLPSSPVVTVGGPGTTNRSRPSSACIERRAPVGAAQRPGSGAGPGRHAVCYSLIPPHAAPLEGERGAGEVEPPHPGTG